MSACHNCPHCYNVRVQLAPYAFRDEDTEGRRFPEDPHPYRSDYQRDRDRILHSKAFRRLERKTQVFAPDYSDHFRNRLTHTLEVSQISRTISRALGLNSDLCEVLALSHDIGHPPFSHEGEKVLNQLMAEMGSGFEHNLHALRIVEDFEEKYPAFRGLNLTFEVREGIIKHSRDFEKAAQAYVPIEEYRLGERPPLEAQLIDIADEIAYNSADLDDGYDSGLLGVDQLCNGVEIFSRHYHEVRRRHPGAVEKLKVSETVRRLINELVTGVIHQTREVLLENAVSCVDQVRRAPRRLVAFIPELGAKNQELKAFLHTHLYDHAVLKEAREQTQLLLHDLFSFYLDRPDQLPASHFALIDQRGLPRVVCDYIAGMTDAYAHLKHSEIMRSKDTQASIIQ